MKVALGSFPPSPKENPEELNPTWIVVAKSLLTASHLIIVVGALRLQAKVDLIFVLFTTYTVGS